MTVMSCEFESHFLHEKNEYCGNSSVGRAQPCQGWGREFESRFPLNQTKCCADRPQGRNAQVAEW